MSIHTITQITEEETLAKRRIEDAKMKAREMIAKAQEDSVAFCLKAKATGLEAAAGIRNEAQADCEILREKKAKEAKEAAVNLHKRAIGHLDAVVDACVERIVKT